MGSYYIKPEASKINKKSYITNKAVSASSHIKKAVSGPSYVVKQTGSQKSAGIVPSKFGGITGSKVSSYYIRPNAGQLNTPIPQIIKEKIVIPTPGEDASYGSDLRTPADPLSLSFIGGGPPCVFGGSSTYSPGSPAARASGAAGGATSYPTEGVVTATGTTGILGGIGSAVSDFGSDVSTNLLILIALIIGLGLLLGGGKK